MALYELRTYTLYVGKMAEAVKLYQEFGFPALNKGGHDKHLIGYFQGDTGMINQLVHLWKFEDDAGRRAHVGAGKQQRLHQVGVVFHRRPVQRGHAVALCGVDVGGLLQQRPHRVAVARHRRIRHRRRRRGVQNRRQRERAER